MTSASHLISPAPLSAALIRIVTALNQNSYGTSMQTIKLVFRYFHYTWFADWENLCFILILKEKMTRLILLISLTLK